KLLRHYLKGDGLACAGCARDQAVAVGHVRQEINGVGALRDIEWISHSVVRVGRQAAIINLLWNGCQKGGSNMKKHQTSQYAIIDGCVLSPLEFRNGDFMPTGSYINGKWIHPNSERVIRNINPADPKDVIAEFPAATAQDVQNAIEAAQAAFPDWKNTPSPERGRVLWRAVNLA